MTAVAFDEDLDCRGLACPLPKFKTKQAIDSIESGKVLRMVSTDPGSVKDMDAWLRQTGHTLQEHIVEGSEFIYYVRKK